MRIEEHQARRASGTSEEILGEIRDYCRATRTSESTFGRLVVNDGKLVSRLRDGARITTGTLDKVRRYLAEHSPADAPAPRAAVATTAASQPDPAAETGTAPAGFRFFDNRQ